ncbi:uncharacterized protein LOC144344329 [Saccoglossus kowalevskii]
MGDVFTTINDIPQRESMDNECNIYGLELLEFCKSTNLKIVNGRLFKQTGSGNFTYVSGIGTSVVDYILTSPNNLSNFTGFSIGNRIESDHLSLELTMMLSSKHENSTIDTVHHNTENLNKLKWDTKKANIYRNNFNSEGIRNLRHEFYENVIEGNIDDAATNLTNIIYTCGKDMVCKSKQLNECFRNFWFDKECLVTKRAVSKALNHYRHTKSQNSLEYYLLSKQPYQKLIKEKKAEFQKLRRDELINLSKQKNSHKFWQKLKQHKINVSENITMEEWSNYFTNLFTPVLVENENYNDFYVSIEDYMTDLDIENIGIPDVYLELAEFNQPITMTEVKKNLDKLKANKSPGPDGIHSEFWKFAPLDICDLLYSLYNKVFDQGAFPIEWSRGLISPVYKKGCSKLSKYNAFEYYK